MKYYDIFIFLLPDFITIQRNSFYSFLEKGIIKEFSKRNPIINSNKTLELIFYPEYYKLNPPEWNTKEAILKSKTYACRLYIPAQLTNHQTKDVKLQWVLLGNLPLMTKRGHFIINGSPRVIVNQMIRSPGIYYQQSLDKKKNETYFADLISYRGAWLRLETDKKKRIWARMKKTPKISILVFLQALGLTKESIFQSILYSDFLKYSFLKENHPLTTQEALITLYSKTHPKKDKTEITANLGQKFLFRKFLNPKTYDLGILGRLRLNKKLGISVPLNQYILTQQDFLYATDYLIKLENGNGAIDDIDNLKNRRVRASGELIQNQLSTGLIRLEKLIRDKMKKPKKNFTIKSLITTKPINGALREFFGSSQLSQFMDETNPLSEITHKRRVTSLGPGGISRETAGMAVRGIHPTHYGRICPIETPEGQNAGLVNSISTYARIDSNGFLETPFYEVYNGQIQNYKKPIYFSAQDEEKVIIAPGDLNKSKLNFLSKNLIPARFFNEFKRVYKNEIQYIGLSPIQMISIATSLIPFLEHDDANRALMGSNMQRQAVPLMISEKPIVGTGLEFRVASDSGHIFQTKYSGYISSISNQKIVLIIKPQKLNKFSLKFLFNFYFIPLITDVFIKTFLKKYSINFFMIFNNLKNKKDYKNLKKKNLIKSVPALATVPDGQGSKDVKNEIVTLPSLKKDRMKGLNKKEESSFIFRSSPSLFIKIKNKSKKDKELLFFSSKLKKHSFYIPRACFDGQPTNKKLIKFLLKKNFHNYRIKFFNNFLIQFFDNFLNNLINDFSCVFSSEEKVTRNFCSKATHLREQKYEGSIKKKYPNLTNQNIFHKTKKTSSFLNFFLNIYFFKKFNIYSLFFDKHLAKKKIRILNKYNYKIAEKPIILEATKTYKFFYKKNLVNNTGEPLKMGKKTSHNSFSKGYEKFSYKSKVFFTSHTRFSKGYENNQLKNNTLTSDNTFARAELSVKVIKIKKDVQYNKLILLEKNLAVFIYKTNFLHKLKNIFLTIPMNSSKKSSVLLGREALPVTQSMKGVFTPIKIFTLEEKLENYRSLKDERFPFNFFLNFLNFKKFIKFKSQKNNYALINSNFRTSNSNVYKTSLLNVEYNIQKFHRSNQDTCVVQKPLVKEGEWIQKGDILADGIASIGGELSLGKNILIAYMPWEGYNFEDAILINERLVFDDVYTSIHIEKYEVEIRDTKFGIEQITAQIPEINYSEIFHLDKNGIAKPGTWVKEGDILIGKITPIKKKPLTPHEKLLYDIVGKEIPITRDTSLRVPKGVHGRVIDVQILETENIPPEIPFEGPGRVHIYLAEKRRIQVGDKMAGRHGNKGIVSKILPRHDMPYLPDGTSVDMVLNPLGVPSRMNVGQVFECLLGLAGLYLKQQFKIQPFDEMSGSEASRSIVYSKLYEARKKSGQTWLFTPDFPGKTILFDGRTGEFFHQPITVGQAYMLKLVHLVDEKIHARSTGPYSLVTQQPLRGRSKHGGQRLGEMEVWALEGFGAAYTLQELLTIKSDDMKGRHQVMDAILNNEPIALGTPESFKVLIKELQSLCLDVGVYSIDSSGKRKQIDVMKMS
uniref:DNA-directed RNA polymerase subunit beta n=1 Tax=Interfilum terricola TaxID=163310 RepID=A0A097KPN7_9VIRI|nr:beta subunit of RNA polymerase [Interfilum terricola]AIT95125.1 beta subunit of RNA polymerase [Interfilum terricola]